MAFYFCGDGTVDVVCCFEEDGVAGRALLSVFYAVAPDEENRRSQNTLAGTALLQPYSQQSVEEPEPVAARLYYIPFTEVDPSASPVGPGLAAPDDIQFYAQWVEDDQPLPVLSPDEQDAPCAPVFDPDDIMGYAQGTEEDLVWVTFADVDAEQTPVLFDPDDMPSAVSYAEEQDSPPSPYIEDAGWYSAADVINTERGYFLEDVEQDYWLRPYAYVDTGNGNVADAVTIFPDPSAEDIVTLQRPLSKLVAVAGKGVRYPPAHPVARQQATAYKAAIPSAVRKEKTP